MKVVKRTGDTEDVSFDKVLRRLKFLSDDINVDIFAISQKVCSRIYDGVNTSELDELAAQLCSSMMIEHPDYGKLAARIIISNHHKNTSPSFSETIYIMYNNKDREGNPSPLINKTLYDMVMDNKTKLNTYIDHTRDYSLDYFGFKTLERSYLTKVDGKIVERPQYMWMRVALGIHADDFKDALQTYDLMSKKYFTHATPTLFNSGTIKNQLSSCFEANTLVNTLRGPKRIIDVEIGDEVITHKGNVKKVTQLHENLLGNRKLYEVEIYKTNKFIATEDHKLWVYNNVEDKIYWKEIKNLSKNDYICIPNYKGQIKEEKLYIKDILGETLNNESKIIYDKDVCYTQFIRTVENNSRKTFLNGKIMLNSINIDKNFMKFLGIWYGDGHIIRKKNRRGEKKVYGIGITIENSNSKLIDFCKSMKDHFGLEHISIHNMKNQNITVAGRSFKIRSDADGKYLQGLADTISKRFNAISSSGGRQDQDLRVMAMVAIGLLDEFNDSNKKLEDIKEHTKLFTTKMIAKIDELLAGKSL